MKNIKRALLTTAVIFVILAPVVMSAVPAFATTNDGGGGGGTSGDTPQQRVDKFLYYNAVWNCFNSISGYDGSGGVELSTSQVTSGHWLDGAAWGATNFSHNAVVGYHDTDDGNGQRDCSDFNGDGINDAIAAIYGSSSDETMLSAICHIQPVVAHAGDSSSASDYDACFNSTGGGSNTYRLNAGDGKALAKQWTNSVKALDANFPVYLSNLSPQDLYYLYFASFALNAKTCDAKSQGAFDPTDPVMKAKANDSGYAVVDTIGSDGTITPVLYTYKNNEFYAYDTGDGSHNQTKVHCDDLIKKIAPTGSNYDQHTSVVNAAAAYVAAGGDLGLGDSGGTGTGIGDSAADGPQVDCGGFGHIISNPINWLACSVLKGFSEAAKQLDDGIMSMLCVDENQIFNDQSTCNLSLSKDNNKTAEAYKNAWNVFRIIGLGLIVIAGLVMILSQTSGFEMVDAYTIRKVMPRLVVAAIAISLSWYLMEFFVTLSNFLGIGIRALIYAPFDNAGLNKITVQGGSGAIASLFALGGLGALGALGVLSFVVTALLAILIAFFILILRNILVIILLITAPIAIVCYVLPNTEHIWKLWWSWFSKALMVFPIITAFIAAGHVFAAIAVSQGDGTITTVIAFAAYFAPYFLIPATFRFAGGALATIGGFANDRSRGAFDRLKKYRGNQTAKNWQAMKEGNRFRGGTHDNFRGKINRGLQRGTRLNPETLGVNPANWRANMNNSIGNQEFDHAMEAMEKNAAFRVIAADDDLLEAGLAGGESQVRKSLYDKGQRGSRLDQNVASIMAAKRSMSDESFGIAAAVATAGTKTGFATTYNEDGTIKKGGNQQMAEAVDRVTHGDEALGARVFAAARNQAGRANRTDLAGHSFGKGIGETYAAVRGGASSEDDLNIDTLLNNDLTTIGRSDSRALEAITGSAVRRVNDIHGRMQDDPSSVTEKEKEQLGQLTKTLENASQNAQFIPSERQRVIARALDDTTEARTSVKARVDAAPAPGQDTESGGVPIPADPLVRGYTAQATRGDAFGANDPRRASAQDQQTDDNTNPPS